MCFVSERRFTSRMSWPSIRMAPPVTSYPRLMSDVIVVLPAPVWPTKAIVSPGSTCRSMSRNTGTPSM